MRKTAILFAIGILGGVMPGSVPALSGQAIDQPTPGDTRSTPTEAPLEESIVVTATLEEEAEDEIPATVTVVGREEIEARQETAVVDLLRTIPGVDVARSGSPGKVTSVFVRGANSNQTLVLWNGVELNDPYFGGFDWSFLPTEGVDRVEVVRGPFSALWGSQAIGGVVQVMTRGRDDLQASRARIVAEGGSDDYRRGAVSAGFRSGRFRLDVAGHTRRGEGRVDNDFFDGEELTAHAGWRFGEDDPTAGFGVLDLGLVARANRAEIGIPFDFAGTPLTSRVQERESEQIAVPISWTSSRERRWSVDARLGRTELDLALRDPGSPFAESDTDGERTSGRLVATRRFGLGGEGGTSWVAAGVDWKREEVTNVSSFAVFDGESATTRSGFGEVFLRSGRWTADLGLRHDDHDAFGGETTAKLSGAVDLTSDLRLRAGYGQGFRAPSLGDLYYPGFSNPDLRPEESESFEVGAEWSPGRSESGWSFSATGFSTDYDELIVFDPVTSRPINLGQSRARGVELAAGWVSSARGLLGGHLAVHLSGTLQETEDRDTGEPLLRRADESAQAVVTWRPDDRRTLSGVVRHVGERADFGTTLPSYTVLDLAGSWRLPLWDGRLAPRVRVENVTGEEYEEVAGFPAPERAYVLGLSLDVGTRE